MDLHAPLIEIVQLLNVKFTRLLEKALLRVLCDLCALCGSNFVLLFSVTSAPLWFRGCSAQCRLPINRWTHRGTETQRLLPLSGSTILAYHHPLLDPLAKAAPFHPLPKPLHRLPQSRDKIIIRLKIQSVSYTHLTLPTNREV